MNLNNKIEEIRQKPEHIRIRYVWGAVSVSMLIIIIIWIFSLQSSFSKKTDSGNEILPDLQQNLDETKNLNETTPSIKDMLNESEKTPDEGILEGQVNQ